MLGTRAPRLARSGIEVTYCQCLDIFVLAWLENCPNILVCFLFIYLQMWGLELVFILFIF